MPLIDKLEKSNIKPESRSHRVKYSKNDLKFMSSLSQAVIEKTHNSFRFFVWFLIVTTTWLIIWASYAEIDEITRGQGKVIPSEHTKKIQNLEGGIIEEIYVREGSKVEVGEQLLKVNDIGFKSSYAESRLRLGELQARAARLLAEKDGKAFDPPEELEREFPKLVEHERVLHKTNMQKYTTALSAMEDQLNQKRNELEEVRSKHKSLEKNFELIQKEIRITKPLVTEELVSEVQFLQLERQAGTIESDLKATKIQISRSWSKVEETKKNIEDVKLEFAQKAQTEYNEVVAEIGRIAETQNVLEDRVMRTIVRSPVKGTIKQLMVNTIGGVIQPGMDLLEIVPDEDNLVVEVKINPKDIAFLHPGQDAVLKFSAYDFSIHGGLRGKVFHISADTIEDENRENFYLVKIRSNKNHLGSEENPLEIIVGMTVDADILTGKKTVLDYLLKPIFKAKQNAMRER